MSDDLAAPAGIRGTAVRAAPGARVRLFGTVIDEYVITPTAETLHHPVHVSAIVHGPDMVCVVFRVDGRVLDRMRKLRLPPESMAAQLIAATPMWTVPNGRVADLGELAKVAIRGLVRGAVEGTLPLVDGPAAYAAWEAAAEAVCKTLIAGVRATTG